MYDDGSPGEIFVVMAKQGSVVSGLMDTVATSISLALQYGVPLKVLVDKFSHTRFERRDSPTILKSLLRNRLWIIFSAGWVKNSCQPKINLNLRPTLEPMGATQPLRHENDRYFRPRPMRLPALIVVPSWYATAPATSA